MKSKDKNIINLTVGSTHIFIELDSKTVRYGTYNGSYPAKDYDKVGSLADVEKVIVAAEELFKHSMPKLPQLMSEDPLLIPEDKAIEIGCTRFDIKDARKALNAMLKAVTK